MSPTPPSVPAPHFTDLQVNGYGGVDFNADDLNGESLANACQLLARDGVGAVLATVITDHLDAMCRRIRRLVQLREADPLIRQMIAGLHVEGPYLSDDPGFRGAHPADALRNADPQSTLRLLEAGDGLTKIVTLAPERDPNQAVIRLLSRSSITVSAGHTNASLDVLRAACDAGLSMFTHLGNGCPRQLDRHDNIIQRALALRDRLWICLIADGVHVPLYAVRNYLDLCGTDRCIIVTDAMAAAGMGPGTYALGRWTCEVGDDLAAWAPFKSHLLGSAVTMVQSAANLRTIGASEAQIQKLTLHNPMSAIGMASPESSPETKENSIHANAHLRNQT